VWESNVGELYMRIFGLLLLACALLAGQGVFMNVNALDTGICFRMDDNQTLEKWRQTAEVFDRYGFKFCASINSGKLDKGYVELIKELQAKGHEIMDHTPLHSMVKFTFAPGKKAKDYEGLPGVDHISGSTVFLKYDIPAITAKVKFYKVEIDGSKLILKDILDEKEMKIIKQSAVVYFPETKTICSKRNAREKNVFNLRSIWDENNIKIEKAQTQAAFFSCQNFPVPPETVELIARNSLDNFAAIGAGRPYTWIQPGGGVSVISSETAKKVLGDKLGYLSAATYVGSSWKVFNEYNAAGNCAYGMMWGDFDSENRDLEWNITKIADLTALNHVAIDRSHMHPKEGWEKYLARVDKILAWCVKNKIPVKTQRQWSEELYAAKYPAPANVFPGLGRDLDGNGIPDGYVLANGVWDESIRSITAIKRGLVFSVNKLGGLVKGGNKLSFKLSADTETEVTVAINFYLAKKDNLKKTVKFSKGETKEYSLNIDIPEKASVADFSFTVSSNGKFVFSAITLSGLQK